MRRDLRVYSTSSLNLVSKETRWLFGEGCALIGICEGIIVHTKVLRCLDLDCTKMLKLVYNFFGDNL